MNSDFNQKAPHKIKINIIFKEENCSLHKQITLNVILFFINNYRIGGKIWGFLKDSRKNAIARQWKLVLS
ncbi:hypothetical protein CO115_04695 [Candidatus Falkowbacteria bacterium CG_4_9_14_3_um_filter_36_9]|uniref:Uncharacterized protein n=2 Tax=Candidatus Falkowiibacteriota TaxID=1752728 RepID=A0A1J4TAC2_9BACT|nr:MAG: hypothetical protein AUJ27_01740 [Candidatus Falkowbacteria bacterium CG1_02_37_44]PIV50637.1 MAG: hypothetical protein COS18_04405 [Candidatus Falkowbacteria bacterium CG02_land_8_20_14_3_00_36_14]PJB18376.1 MAG: hypothetical protein CO115_04695 [Candidatus Falkowbacteria bacterium CG_4_9_14_3_um_filter_36_9]